MPTTNTPTTANPYRIWALFISMAIATIMSQVDLTGINVALAAMGGDLHLNLSEMQWILNIYLLTYCALIVVAGRLGDLYGRRNIFILGLIIFMVSSLCAGVAHNAWQIILARAFQGVGAACSFSLTTVIIYSSVPEQQRAQALGILFAIVGIGLAVGPPIAGWLIDIANWRWIFLVNMPLGIISGLLAFFFISKEKPNTGPIILDYLGVLLLTAALCLLIYILSQISTSPSFSFILLAGFIASILLFTLFYFHEKRHPQPLVSTDLLHNAQYMTSCVIRLLAMYSFYVPLFIVSLYLQNILQYSASQAGDMFLAMTVMIALSSPPAGRLITKIGIRYALIIAMLPALLGFIVMANFTTATPTIWILVGLALFGIGFGLFSPVLLRAAMHTVSEDKLGVASATFYMASVTGGMISVALASAILNDWGTKKLTALASLHGQILNHTQANAIMQWLYSETTGSGKSNYIILKTMNIVSWAHQAFMSAFTLTMWLGVLSIGTALIIILTTVRK